MSETNKDGGPARMEVDVQRPPVGQVDVGAGTATSIPSAGTHVDLGFGAGPEDDEPEENLDGGAEPDAPEPDPDDAADTPEEGALPDYDGTDEAVRKQYDERYFTDAGTVNLSVLSREFFTNEAKGEGKLNAGTYAYLKDSLGLDEASVKEIERGQVALREQATAAFYARIDGGKDAYEAAVKWGSAGGYTQAQRDAYNRAKAQGGEAYADAVDALMARHAKATGKASGGSRRGPPQARRPSTPSRDVTASSRSDAGGAAGEKFANQAEYAKVWQESLAAVADARRSGDLAALRKAEEAREAVRKKGRKGFRG